MQLFYGATYSRSHDLWPPIRLFLTPSPTIQSPPSLLNPKGNIFSTYGKGPMEKSLHSKNFFFFPSYVEGEWGKKISHFSRVSNSLKFYFTRITRASCNLFIFVFDNPILQSMIKIWNVVFFQEEGIVRWRYICLILLN